MCRRGGSASQCCGDVNYCEPYCPQHRKVPHLSGHLSDAVSKCTVQDQEAVRAGEPDQVHSIAVPWPSLKHHLASRCLGQRLRGRHTQSCGSMPAMPGNDNQDCALTRAWPRRQLLSVSWCSGPWLSVIYHLARHPGQSVRGRYTQCCGSMSATQHAITSGLL